MTKKNILMSLCQQNCSFITVALSFEEPRSESPLLLSNKSSPRLRLQSAEIARAKKWNRISLAESDKFHSATDLGKLSFLTSCPHLLVLHFFCNLCSF